MMTRCQDHISTENIWFVWSKTSYSGDKWRCHGCRTYGRTNKEDSATQPMDCWRLSLANTKTRQFGKRKNKTGIEAVHPSGPLLNVPESAYTHIMLV